MKTSFKIIGAIFAVAFIGLTAQAQSQYDLEYNNVFCVSSTNQAGATNFVVVPNNSANGGAPVVTYVSYGADVAGSRVQAYRATAMTQAAYSTNQSTTISVITNLGFATGDIVVIKHVRSGSVYYEKQKLGTITSGTNLVTVIAPFQVVFPGDIIWRYTSSGAGSIPVGVATNSVSNAAGVLMGQRNTPLLIEIGGTSFSGLPAVSGFFAP